MNASTNRHVLRPELVDLGVNVGRLQHEDEPDSAVQAGACRVVIDVHSNGGFTVYADPDVQVICRCACIPEDELVQVSLRPIPEEWLNRTIGHRGDGTLADLLAEVIVSWPT